MMTVAESTQPVGVADVSLIEAQLQQLPIVQQLRRDSELRESRPHSDAISEADKPHNFSAGTLAGPGRFTVPSLCFADAAGKNLVIVAHVGDRVSGYPGIIHGGLLAT